MEELWGLRGHQYLHQESLEPARLLTEKPLSEWPVPQFVNLFLPEFPIRPLRGHHQLKVGQSPEGVSVLGRHLRMARVSIVLFSISLYRF